MLLPTQNSKPYCVVFSLQYGVKLCWPEEMGEMRSKPKSYPKRKGGQKLLVPLQFSMQWSRASPLGNWLQACWLCKEETRFLSRKRTMCCSIRSWQHGSLLTLHTGFREASVREPGVSSKQSCLEYSRPGQQTRGSGRTWPGLGEVQMHRHPSPGPAWPSYCLPQESWGWWSAG